MEGEGSMFLGVGHEMRRLWVSGRTCGEQGTCPPSEESVRIGN